MRVHNLKNISLALPLGRLIVVAGVSGSGKSSLALDTLYAEGQRRYIETFSPYARQFLERMDKPDADRIEPIPPAVALRQGGAKVGSKSTIATATEIHDHLRLLYARLGQIVCPTCRREVRRRSPQDVLDAIRQFAPGTRFQIAFSPSTDHDASEALPAETMAEQLLAEGFDRAIVARRTGSLRDDAFRREFVQSIDNAEPQADMAWIIVDRLSAGRAEDERVLDSVELAFRHGDAQCALLEMLPPDAPLPHSEPPMVVDGRPVREHRFSHRLACGGCGREFVAPEPALFSFSSPLGACPECHGFGAVPGISFEKLVPDASKSLREGAIAPWTTPAYRHELDELLALAGDYGLPVDVPFAELTPEHRALIRDGVPERKFGGLRGFFRWLERHKYKLSVRVLLSRWRSYETCPACHGDRLQPAALAVRLPGDDIPPSEENESLERAFGPNLAELARYSIADAHNWLERLPERLSEAQREISRIVRNEVRVRLRYLDDVGLGYLTLDRAMRTLSSGEAQRVALTGTLGSHLVNMLYVLDEPSAGLHPRDSERVVAAVQKLRSAGNTVVCVEHEDAFLAAADHIVEIGPGAGADGGQVVFQGTPGQLAAADSLTGRYYSGRLGDATNKSPQRRLPGDAWLRLAGARRHNLKNITVEFPLGLLCVVTGVSGSGKSTLVEETLYPALCRALKLPCTTEPQGAHDRLDGAHHLDEVILVDASPIGRTARSNPVTYVKAFDEIRKLFAATPEAKLRHFTATHFSFNTATGGRCPQCEGTGTLSIDMQFLPDIDVVCPECHGTRYRRDILDVKYRGLTIAEVLNLTVREAFTFFARQPRLQKKLQLLKEVGLDYLPLGQPATTLSGGESQRLKLAAHLGAGSRSRILFLLDEPTTGLHPADIARLLDCFHRLVDVGHSLIIIEHNLDVIGAADYVIDLGPEAGDRGGDLVAAGPPEDLARNPQSLTGRYLRDTKSHPA